MFLWLVGFWIKYFGQILWWLNVNCLNLIEFFNVFVWIFLLVNLRVVLWHFYIVRNLLTFFWTLTTDFWTSLANFGINLVCLFIILGDFRVLLTDFRVILIFWNNVRLFISLFRSPYLFNGFEPIFKRLFIRMKEKVIFFFSILSLWYFISFIWLLVISICFCGRFRDVNLMRVRNSNILLTFILMLEKLVCFILSVFVLITNVWILFLWLNRKLSLLWRLFWLVITVLFGSVLIVDDLVILAIIIITIVHLDRWCLALGSYRVYLYLWSLYKLILWITWELIIIIIERA